VASLDYLEEMMRRRMLIRLKHLMPQAAAAAAAAAAPTAAAAAAPVDSNKTNTEECCPCNKNNIGDMLNPTILKNAENKIVEAQKNVVTAVTDQVNAGKATVQEKTGLLGAFFGNSKDNKPEVVDKPALGQAGGRKRKRRISKSRISKRRISKRRISRKGRKSQRRSKKSKRITRRRR